MTSTMKDHPRGDAADSRGERVLIVSGDSHCGPSLEHQLRPYCPADQLEAFDAYAAAVRKGTAAGADVTDSLGHNADRLTMTRLCAGLQDPHARLADMDDQGVTADVIFAGGQNDEPLPFVGGPPYLFGAGALEFDRDQVALGHHIWNQWLADFVAVEPRRLRGVFQVPIWDVEATVKEMQWARDHGLSLMSFPAPRQAYAPYNYSLWEPLWSAVEDLDITLVTHGGGGEMPLGWDGPGGMPLLLIEIAWLSRRALWQMIFGEVVERHPSLKVVFTEQRVAWVGETLKELDSVQLDTFHKGSLDRRLPRLPSDYWRSNFFVCASFLAPYEAALRHECGVDNLIWGSDYPHVESTWPDTMVSLRNTLAGVPEDEVRRILGENAVRVYDLDGDYLRGIADRIGPTMAQLTEPVRPEEFPAEQGLAFRTAGSYH